MTTLTQAELMAAHCNGDVLMPLAQAAEMLDVTPSSVRWWVRAGRLGCTFVDGRQHVLLEQASVVEHEMRQSTRGRPRQMTTV